MNERALYAPVIRWLRGELQDRFPRADVEAYDTHSASLAAWLDAQGLSGAFPEHTAWDIKVDVTGLIKSRRAVDLVFVECKTSPLTLGHVGQILGYCLVGRPRYALLLSTSPPNRRLVRLLTVFGRQDVLQYGPGRTIKLVTWDSGRGQPYAESLIPPTGSIL